MGEFLIECARILGLGVAYGIAGGTAITMGALVLAGMSGLLEWIDKRTRK